MPVLSKFYGIVIRLLACRSLDARIHAVYGENELVIGLWPLRVVSGDAPMRVRTMVLEWATLHQQELLMAWNGCLHGSMPKAIQPLE